MGAGGAGGAGEAGEAGAAEGAGVVETCHGTSRKMGKVGEICL